MGSLPNSDQPSPKMHPEILEIQHLFESQHKYINFFFQNLDLSQTHSFAQTLLNTKGTVFFTGIGKSGFVAQKISQTLVSLGIKSAFLCPTGALHGDIGILETKDVLVFFSKSGNTEELLRLVPCARAKGVFLIGISSSKSNLLSNVCDLNVYLPLERELCPFDLAPVTSTAIQMIFGDTVAVALMRARNLSRDDYAANHPAGRIGKSLIFKVKGGKNGALLIIVSINELVTGWVLLYDARIEVLIGFFLVELHIRKDFCSSLFYLNHLLVRFEIYVVKGDN